MWRLQKRVWLNSPDARGGDYDSHLCWLASTDESELRLLSRSTDDTQIIQVSGTEPGDIMSLGRGVGDLMLVVDADSDGAEEFHLEY